MVERVLLEIPSQLQLQERLRNIIYLSSSILLVSGETGSGKTTFVEQLSNALPEEIQQVFVQASEHSTDSQIRLQILTQLYEQALFDDTDSLFDSMSHLEQKEFDEKARLIILDNAEYLSPSLLAELSQIIADHERICKSEMSILLLGEPAHNSAIFSNLKKFNKNTQCIEFKIPQLSEAESSSLLIHFLSQMHHISKMPNQDALEFQLNECCGNPAKIAALADEISSGASFESDYSWFQSKFPALFLMILMLCFVALIGYFLYPKFFKNTDSQIEPAAIVTEEIAPVEEVEPPMLEPKTETENIEPEKKPEVPQVQGDTLAGTWDLPEIKDNNITVGLQDLKSKQRVVITDQNILKLESINKVSSPGVTPPQTAMTPFVKSPKLQQKVEIIKPTAALIDPILIKPVLNKKTDQIVANNPKEKAPKLLDASDKITVAKAAPLKSLDNKVTKIVNIQDQMQVAKPLNIVATKANKTQKVIVQKAILSAEPINIKAVEVETTKSIPLPATKKATPKTNDPQIALVTPVIIEGKTQKIEYRINNNITDFSLADPMQLNNIDPKHFTLQIEAMESEKSILFFVQENQFNDLNYSIYQTKRNNKPWYVVIVGEYKSRTLAQNAIGTLPLSMRKSTPWIKKYKLVQDDLKLNDK